MRSVVDPAGVAIISPEGDFGHPWVAAFASALARRIETAYYGVGLTADELGPLCATLEDLPEDVREFHAHRSRRAGDLRCARSVERCSTLPSDWVTLQLYTNDVLPSDRVDYIFTDVFLATLADHADDIPGYEWAPEALADALQRELDLLAAARLIFVPSKWLERWARLNLPRHISRKVKVVGFGPGVDLSEVGVSRASNNDVGRATALRLLFVGNESDRKGLPLVLGAYQKARDVLPQLQLHVVGNARVDSGDAGVEVSGYLDWSQPRERRRLVSAYANADLFILPSAFDPSACAYIEAMGAGLPVIASPVCSVPEMVAECGWIVKQNVDDIAEAIVHAAQVPDERAWRGEAGMRRARDHYSWTVTSDAVVSSLCLGRRA